MFANSGFSIDTGSCSLYGATISLGIGRPFSLLAAALYIGIIGSVLDKCSIVTSTSPPTG